MCRAEGSGLAQRPRVQWGRGRGGLTEDQQAGQAPAPSYLLPQQLPDAHKCFEHFLSREKKKKKRSDCLQVFWLHVKVFFSASSVEIKQFLFTIITSAFSQLCARVRA